MSVNALRIICTRYKTRFNVNANYNSQPVQNWQKFQCCLMSSRFRSPFQDHEVYDGDRDELEARDGPVLMQGNYADYMIIGGGVMGQSIAYSLWRHLEQATLIKATKTEGSGNLVIVERDPTLHTSASALAVGGIRSQFSNSSNVKLSLQSSEFLRKIRLNLSTIRSPDPDVQFNHQGYLVLATASGAEQLMKNSNTQTAAGAKIMLFTKNQLQETFPWMNVDDIELGSYGLQHEGWFDPMSLVNAFKHKNKSFPVINITGEVVGFKKEIFEEPVMMESSDGRLVELEEGLRGVYIKMKEYDKPVHIKCGKIINCAGPWAGKLADMAGVGTDREDAHPLLRHKLPVEPRKRYVYVVHCPDAPLLDLPFVVDPSGVYIRREGLGGKYLCGLSPTEEEEPSIENLDVDYDFFYDKVWPKLAERIPAFEKLKVVSAWAGYYDYNTFDQNAILGPHPYYHNLFFMNGFSGHGVQQSCAAGDQLADLILNGSDPSVRRHALHDFSFNRIIDNRPFLEQNII